MNNWKDYLKPEEAERLRWLEETIREQRKERYRIYDRCRARMKTALAKEK